MKSCLPGFPFFNKKGVCQLLFLDLSQGTVCREIGLAGLQLPPLPFLEVAPLSTDAVATDFTASFKGHPISAAVKELPHLFALPVISSVCCHV